MTAKENILNTHAAKTLSEELLEVSLLQNGKLISSGNGKLSVSPNGRLQIEVNAEYIPLLLGSISPGVIISDKELFAINAKTRDNLIFKADRLYMKRTSQAYNKLANALFETSQVTLISNATPQGSPGGEGTLGYGGLGEKIRVDSRQFA